MNHGRLHLISGAIRIIFGIRYPYSISGFYPDYWLRRILAKLNFGEEMAPTAGKSSVSCRSSRSRSSTTKTLEPDFWISAGYLKKLWTDFDEILWVDSCGALHDLVTFWAGAGSESGSWIWTCIQNCKAEILWMNSLWITERDCF